MINPIQLLLDSISSIYKDDNISYNSKLESISHICIFYTQNLNTYIKYGTTKNDMSDQLTPQERDAIQKAWGSYPQVVNQLLSNPTQARAEMAKHGIAVQSSIPSPIPSPEQVTPPPTTDTSKGKRKFASRVFSSKAGNMCLNLNDLQQGYGLGWFKALKDGRLGFGIAKGSVAVQLQIQGTSLIMTSRFDGLSQAELDFLRQNSVNDGMNNDMVYHKVSNIPDVTRPSAHIKSETRIKTKHTINKTQEMEIPVPESTQTNVSKEDQEIIKQAKAFSQAFNIDLESAITTIKRSIVNASSKKRGISKDIPPPNIFTGE